MTTTETLTRPVAAGDIFYGSWGYDQTNVDYYLVVRVTPAKAELKPIGSKVINDQGSYTEVEPDPESYRDFDVIIDTGRSSPYGKPERSTKLCKVYTSWNGETVIRLAKDHAAYRYTGGAKYETGHGFGH